MPVHYAPASGTLSGVWLLVAIPLASAAILLLLGRRADRWGHWLGVASIGAAFVLGLVYFSALRGLSGPYRAADLHLFDYLPVGGLKVGFGLLYDPLSAIFVLLITAAVGAMILAHVERRKEEKVTQPSRMRERFAPGNYPGPKPGPGVFAGSDSVATPARLPGGTPAERSISKILPTRELTAAESAPKGTES